MGMLQSLSTKNVFLLSYLLFLTSLVGQELSSGRVSPIRTANALEALKTEYVIQEGEVLGDYFKLATFRAEFDEQLYLQSGLYCPVCEIPKVINAEEDGDGNGNGSGDGDGDDDEESTLEDLLNVGCVCYYVRGDECGKLKPISDSERLKKKCEKLEQQLGGEDKVCTLKKDLCSTDLDQVRLKDPFKDHLDEDQARNYTLFVTEPCQMYHFQIETTYGDPDVNIYLATHNVIELVFVSFRYGPEDLTLCPIDLQGRQGTLILEVKAYQDPTIGFDLGPGSNFTLTVTPYAVPAALKNNKTKCVEQEKITCLTDDELWLDTEAGFPLSEDLFFSFTLPPGKGCRKFVISASNSFIVSDKKKRPSLNGYGRETTVLATAIGINTVVINQCEEEKTWYIGLRVESPFEFIVASTRGLIISTPFRELNQYNAVWRLFGTSSITCGNVTQFCSSFLFDCTFHLPLYGDRPNPFWPRYPATSGYVKYNRLFLEESLPSIYHSPQEGTVFASAALLRSVVGADTFEPSLYNGFRPEELSSCQVEWGSGQITDKNGVPLKHPLTFQNASTDCDRENFNKISSYITEAIEEETRLFGDSLVNHNYYLDQLGFTSEFQTCLNFGSNLLTSKNETIQVSTSTCPSELIQQEKSQTDPCCNPSLQWSTSCVQRNISLKLSKYAEDVSLVDQLCSDPDCTSTYVVDYGRAIEILDDPLAGCVAIDSTDLVSNEVTWIPFNECRDKFLGANATTGIHCRQDKDCYSGRCDLIRHRCLIPIEEQELNFLICISKNVSPLVLYSVQETLDMKQRVGTVEFGRELKEKLSKRDCATDYDFALDYRTSVEFSTPNFQEACIDTCANARCLDQKCDVPVVCRQYTRRTCFKKFNMVGGDKDSCLADYYCNWSTETCDDGVRSCTKQCEESRSSNQFCGLCENDQDCIEFEEYDDKLSCEKQEVCILPDGSVDPKLSKEDCEQSFQCSDPCYRDGSVVDCNKEECTVNGVCDGAEVFLEPKCVAPSEPYFFHSCDDSETPIGPAFDSNLGCVSLTISTKEECKNTEIPDWKWVKFEDSTRDGCDKAGGHGCLEVISFPTYQGNYMFTNKTQNQCRKSSTGKWKPRFEFTPSRWLSGTMRPLKWKKREYTTRRKWVQSTLDFPRVQRTIEGAIQATISDRRRTESRCRFEGRLAALNTIACNCFSGSTGAAEICKATSSISGFGRVCPTIPATIFVPPTNIFFGGEAVESDSCVDVTITVLSALQFQSYQVENFASSFVEPPYVSNSFSFTNSEGITIGQVIADAFIIEPSASGSLNQKNITGCVGPREEIEVDDKFTLLDFGVLEGDKIIPLKSSSDRVEEREGLGYCLKESPTNKQLIPILLLPDWESASRFSDSSTILLSTLVGLFWLVALFGSFQLFWGFVIQAHRFLFIHYLIIVFTAFCLLRGLYFLLLLENVIQSRFVDYFLTELPTFIYFSAFTVIIFSWADVTAKTRDMSTKRKSVVGILVTLIGNIFMYGIFTMFMILFGLYTTDTVEATCAGRVPPAESELFNNAQYAIAIAYHAWITAVAIILVIIIVIVGWRLLSLLTYSSGVLGTTEKNQRRKRIILSIIMICSVTFLAHTIWVLVLVTTKFRNTILAFCLLVSIEVIPIAFLIFIMSPRATTRKRGESYFSNKTTLSGVATINSGMQVANPDLTLDS